MNPFRTCFVWFLAVIAALFLFPGLSLQAAPQGLGAAAAQAAAGAKPDYSKEPFIIQSTSTKIIFRNDGKETREDTVRILVQANAGLQAWGILHFPYDSAISTLEISYVRVTKPDGSVIDTPASDIQEVTPDISREAPSYSDLKDKQVAVKGFQVGDTLEYHCQAEVTKPLIPGQFWFTQEFVHGVVVLQQELQIAVPRERYVKVKSPDVQPVTHDEGETRVYNWKTASLESTTDQKNADASDDNKVPDVQLTTFHSWDEVGQWFKSLVDPQAAVTLAIQAKADAVTMSATSYNEKVRLLYDFVSTKFRYVGISLGIGRYQPHSAADVLSNDFGDCKDKHTLFAALLAAENIKAMPVLINSSAKMDPDVPSPSQFDHVITALRLENGYQFLDATPEVAPYGLLTEGLRDKQALLIPAQGSATLVQTPKDPPFPPYDHFTTDATLDNAGTLAANSQMTFRGDDEVIFRSLMRRAGQAKWNDVMQAVMSNLGFGGTVSDTSAGSPEATDMPYQITFHYNRKEYSDWANRRITPPIPPFLLPQVPDDEKKPKPLKIGSPGETIYQTNVELPAGSSPSLPASVNLHESFADYTSAYSFSDGMLHSERRLTVQVTEIPVDKLAAYRAFTKAINDDQDTYIPLNLASSNSSGAGSSGGGIAAAGSVSPQETPDALALLRETQQAGQRGDMPAALDAAQRAVNADPRFSLAWFILGNLQVSMNKEDRGIESLKKSIQLDPSDPTRYEPVANALMKRHREQSALEIWRALATARPEDTAPALHAAQILAGQKLYADAAKELEPIAQKNPNDEKVLMQLGLAYLHLPDKDKGAELIVRAADSTHDPVQLNNAAYELAEAGAHLDQALRYSQDSVQQVETLTSKISLNSLTLTDIRSMPAVASDWDTLGWVQYQMGHLDIAEKYLSAGWKLGGTAVIANHLGQVYEKEGKKHDAAVAYANALSSGNGAPEGTDKRLEDVQKGVRFQDHVHPDSIALQDLRTTKIQWKFTSYQSAEFFVLFGAGGKVSDTKFVSGSEQLRDAAKAISAAHFDVAFPGDNPAQILRRGILSCGNSSAAGQCLFVIYPVADVNSVE
jgi:tetratricopeptide (TPR) repeat protein